MWRPRCPTDLSPMNHKRIFIAEVFCCLIWHGLSQKVDAANHCQKATSCGECIQIGPDCAWCSERAFHEGDHDFDRCDEVASLVHHGCPEANIENPQGDLRVDTNRQLTHGRDLTSRDLEQHGVVQIEPQKLTLNLRLKQPLTFTVKFKKAEDHAVDLYYLMRMSKSSKDDFENARSLAVALPQQMRNLTSNFRIGFGSFDKKSIPNHRDPCIRDQNCDKILSFEHMLSLSLNTHYYTEILTKHQMSDKENGSLFEGGFDALMQIAACHDIIGWKTASTRILVVSTDSEFDTTAEGSQDEASLPNDGQCHTERSKETKGSQYSNPSISQLVKKLNENNVHIIFAVPGELQPTYKELANQIPRSKVGTLSANSSSVIQHIVDIYKSLTSEVVLTHSAPKGISLSYKSDCKDGVNATAQDTIKCSNISIGDEVTFRISVTAHECPKKEQENLKIMLLDSAEVVDVALNVICECHCISAHTYDQSYCYQGTYDCGICRCLKGYYGKNCGCHKAGSSGGDEVCRRNNSSDICSRNGVCVCGQCECRRRENPKEVYSGKYCECDNFSCDRANSLICGGNGVCRCGICDCYLNFTGSACDCSLDTTQCVASNGQICNGRGTCECGRCKCTDPKFQGATCELCQTCPGVCAEHEVC